MNLKLCAALLCCAIPALAVDWKALKPQGYVSDFAGVVDAADKTAIEEYAGRVQQATGAQFAFVTVSSLEGEPIEDVANDLFHAWGVGQKKEDNGLMILLSVGDHKSRMEVGGGLGGIIPDSMAGLLLDDMRPALRENEYGTALLTAAQRLGSTIAASKNVQLAPPAVAHPVERSAPDSIPWPLIFMGIFFLLMFLRRRGGGGGGGSGFWPGLLLGQVLSSGRGGYGGGRDGGGFGGFDSGGSGGGFGGFGGGDSGGGGASSGW